FDYRFTPPDAGTFWYHPPLRAGQNRPLHGLLIVQDTTPPRVDDDIALIVADVDDKVTLNGLAALDIHVWPQHRLRPRLANAADRVVVLRLDGQPATIVAIDGQPAEPFVARGGRVTLAPGNRADLLVDAVMKPSSVAPILLQTDAGEVPLARL